MGYAQGTTLEDVQNAEMDILKYFIKVCKKWNLSFYACGGTSIGAVRHGGMIPWDDDIDIGMLRKDYDKLLTLAQEFREPYCLQYPLYENGYYRPHVQIRNSETTAILDSERGHAAFNQGIFIDIFPLDYVDSSSREFKSRMAKAERILRNIGWYTAYGSVEVHSVLGKARHFMLKVLYSIIPMDRLFARHEQLCRSCIFESGKEAGYISLWHASKRWIAPREYYDNFIDVPFEDILIPIPKEYHKLLTQQYGDYMTPVRCESEHGGVFFDIKRPYTDYI